MSSAACLLTPTRGSTRSKGQFANNPFSLGIASGYPTPSSVVLWTRIAPSPFEPGSGVPPDAVIPVRWEIASDPRMRRIVKRGTVNSTAAWGHSVHVEPQGLEPGRDYWYRFTAAGAQSGVGRTRTAPAPNALTARLKLAVVSCQQYEHGFFAAYRHILKDNPDLIVHNGDYIYEATWGKNLVRHHLLPEAKTLDDYRMQYALYKSDPDLLAAHAACPWLMTWDDHEVFNDYAGDNAASPMSVAEFHARRLAAYRAYYENMPLPRQAIPTDADMRLYTQRAFGDLASIYMLDQRQYRSEQACWDTGQRRLKEDCVELKDPARTMLGGTQESWLAGELANTRARWNLLVQGTVMSYIDEDPGPGEQFWGDAWNGYPAARRRLMNQLDAAKVANPVVLTGDVHAFIVSGLHREPGDLESPVIASELVTTSVSSEGTPQDKLDAWRAANPNLLLANGEHRGYLRVDVSHDRLDATLVALDSEKRADTGASVFRKFVIEADQPGPVEA
jgi:alkaline phosphatase D